MAQQNVISRWIEKHNMSYDLQKHILKLKCTINNWFYVYCMYTCYVITKLFVHRFYKESIIIKNKNHSLKHKMESPLSYNVTQFLEELHYLLVAFSERASGRTSIRQTNSIPRLCRPARSRWSFGEHGTEKTAFVLQHLIQDRARAPSSVTVNNLPGRVFSTVKIH